jgi:hypothetical protein
MSATKAAVASLTANATGFGTNQNITRGMDDYVLNLDGATEQVLNVSGNFFHCLLVPTGPVLLRFDDGKQISRNQSQGGSRIYSRVGVFAAVAQQVSLSLGYGTATDARSSVAATITAPISPALNNPPVASVNCGAGAQTLLVAADPNMIECGVKNPSGSAGGIFIGDNTAANNLGYFLEPGEGVFFGTQAALYAWNPNGVAVLVSLIKMRKV